MSSEIGFKIITPPAPEHKPSAAEIKRKEEDESRWTKIMEAGRDVSEKYESFVKASDGLAMMLCLDDDYFLRKVLPAPSTRRDMRRIIDWLDGEKDSLLQIIRKHEKADKAGSARRKLLKKLNLTARQKQLLGIRMV